MTWTSTLARLILACAVPTLLCGGCMVRRVTITENLYTGETRETFVEALDTGQDPSTLRVEAAVVDGDRLEAMLLSQPVGCRTCLEQRAEQVTIRKNKLDNNAPTGIGLMYGLGAVMLIPLVKAKDYDRSDWRIYGPVMAAGIGLIVAPTATLLSTAPRTTIGREDIWLASEDCRDSPCPESPAEGTELFLAPPVAEGESAPVPPCETHPARCGTTGEDGRINFDLAAAGFADEELAGGMLVLYLETDEGMVGLGEFDIRTTGVFSGVIEPAPEPGAEDEAKSP